MISLTISIYPPKIKPIIVETQTSSGTNDLKKELKTRFTVTGYSLVKVIVRTPKGGVFNISPKDYPTFIEDNLPKLLKAGKVIISGILKDKDGNELLITILIKTTPKTVKTTVGDAS